MATNNFKPFGIGAGANVTSQADYEALAALLSGFQTGKASSAQINKAIRQATVMSYVLAQFIANSSGNDVLDNGDTATIITNLITALKANSANDFLQTLNNLVEIKNAGTAAQASARTNLGLGNSAPLNTGTAAGTVAAGNDSRITGAAQKASNLSDLANAATARSNLGLGEVATENLLPITKGGTGANAFEDARVNLGVNRLRQSGTDTVIISPSDNYRLFVADSGVWGVINNIGTNQPLAVNAGGTGGTTAASARSNLGLGSAAIATVGNGAGQVPSMASFTSGSGWMKFPDGTIMQFGTNISGSAGYPTAINFPIPFTTDYRVTCSFDTPTSASDCPAFSTSKINNSGFYLASSRQGSASGAGANWIAIGK